MTDLSYAAPAVVRHTHTLAFPDLRLRQASVRAWNVAGAVLMAVVGAVIASGAAVKGARSAINVGIGFACIPIATAGLAGLWWGVLIAAPLWIGYDHLLGD